ncbi:MAG: hypothetical protein HKP41_20520 [Desulfobacterales bacterium]|nr:hypothetical protein [Desulfobacterales bacterium]
MYTDLFTAIKDSNLFEARSALDLLLEDGVEPWAIHEALFPIIHGVLNPPFINPHLPKMYAINRELVSYMEPEDVALLLRLEVEEYTWREKSHLHAKPISIPTINDFTEVEKAIARADVIATAIALNAFLQAAGSTLLAKKLLLLGSGYLNSSLGHSISCTAFILLEMIYRKDEDPWPVMVSLAEYFCKGNFHQSQLLHYSAISDYPEVYLNDVKRAISGKGIVALHHTITLYAIERSRHFFEHQEYDHALTTWIRMLGDKQESLYPIEEIASYSLPDFDVFFEVFTQYDPILVLNMFKTALSSEKERTRLGRFLIKAVLRCYNGQYNPHFLTGLGALLWILDRFHDHPIIVLNGSLQYLDFFFSNVGHRSIE